MLTKAICLIAARGGSKGVPKKNIRIIGKKPLIAHAIKQALNSGVFTHVIVSTEDREIAKISRKYGAEVPFYRPKKLASSNVDMDHVVLHAIKSLEKLGYEFDIIVNRDCTAPFIPKTALSGSINLLKKRKCDLVIAAYLTHLNPFFNMMELNSNGFLRFSKSTGKKIVSRQTAPKVYQLTGLYTINVSSFKRYKKIHMPKTLPYEIPPDTGLMIDTEYEFQIAREIMNNHIHLSSD